MNPEPLFKHLPTRRFADTGYGRRGVPVAVIVAAMIITMAFSSAAWAIVIDDFSTSQGPVEQGPPDTASGPGILGDFRDVSITGDQSQIHVMGGAAQMTMSLSFGAGLTSASFTYDGDTGSGLIPRQDLTDGGTSNGFILDISSFSSMNPQPLNWGLWIIDDHGISTTTDPMPIAGAGVIELPFEDLPNVSGPGFPPVDVSVVGLVQLFFTIELEAGTPVSVTIESFTTGFVDTEPDGDEDGIPDSTDNCPATSNPLQQDSDADGAGDLCDVCPADETDTCDPSGSDAQEITPADGGTVATGDGLTVDFDPGDLNEATTIVVSRNDPAEPSLDLFVSGTPGLGTNIGAWDLEPDGLVFNNPATLTLVIDVSALNQMQRDNLDIYRDEGAGTFNALGAECNVVEDPAEVFTATCNVEIAHFSLHAMLAPLDSDDDGVPDQFNGVEDICPFDFNPGQEDICDAIPIIQSGFESPDAP